MTVFHALPQKCPAPATAVALGMFDGLHRGHMSVLTSLTGLKPDTHRSLSCVTGGLSCPNHVASASLGPVACVFTFSTNNKSPDSKTYGRILSERSRDAILADLGIEYVLEPEFSDFRDMSPEEFAKDFLVGYLNAKLIFCGEDFRFGKNAAASAEDLRRLLPDGVQAKIIPLVRDEGGVISTTRIRSLIQSGDMRRAAGLLGRPFSIDFPVGHGRQLGRTLGIPTINQAFPADFVRPRFGVYASVAAVDGERYASVTNVGVKPTVGSDRVLAETYIEGFSGDLYGRNVPVELVEFIRDERKFESVDALAAQIRDNIARSKAITG